MVAHIADTIQCLGMRGSRKFCQRGSKFDYVFFLFLFFVFLVVEGIEDPNTAINGPSSTRQLNAILMVFRWRADVSPTLIAGLVALRFFGGSGPILQRNPIFFVIFQGEEGGPDPCPPPSGSAHIR